LKDKYKDEINDLTPEVLKNLAFLGIDFMIPIGGDDTLSYGVRLYKEGVKVIAIPKTMDNDVPGTDYCIGFQHLYNPDHYDDPYIAYFSRVHMNDSLYLRFLEGMRVLPPCCQPWQGQQTVA
jgi:hypothetical protein